MLQQEKVEQKQINKQTRHHHVTKLQLPQHLSQHQHQQQPQTAVNKSVIESVGDKGSQG